MEKINGNKVASVRTLKSWYDNDTVAVYIEQEQDQIRLSTGIIKEMLKDYDLVIEKKQRYYHIKSVQRRHQ